MSLRQIGLSTHLAVHMVASTATAVAASCVRLAQIAPLLPTHAQPVAVDGPHTHAVYRLIDNVNMSPTGSGAPGAAFIQELINWFGQYGLWAALIALILGGAIYGFATLGGNGYQGSRGRSIALAGCAGAAIIGLAPTVINLVFHAAFGA